MIRIYFFSFAVVLGGALAAVWLGWPIPWLLGSLAAGGLCSINGIGVKAPPLCRELGLSVIGLSLGLYFTPQMGGFLFDNALWLVCGMLFALLLGIIGTWLLMRLHGTDFQTAWFASAVGGASEMAYLSARHGAQVDLVVAAHSLRVLLIVSLVPAFYQFAGLHGADGSVLAVNREVHFFGLAALLAAGWAAAKLFEWRDWSNPWTFGPMFAAIVLTVSGVHLSAVPDWLSAAGQLCIGWGLGTKFGKGFFRRAPKFLSVVALNVLISLILTFGLTLAVAEWSGLPSASVGLGLAPGGVAEMTVTAKVLQLGVPLVTAFHVCRMLAVVATAGGLSRRFARFFERGGTE